MLIIFSRHAILKMGQRRIPRAAAIEAVKFPDFRMPGRNLREELYKRFGVNYLKVVIKPYSSKIVVITAHLVAKVKKN